MKYLASFAALLVVAIAVPTTPLSSRQSITSKLPVLKEITYRVSNTENLADIKFVDTTLLVNGGALNFDESNDLVGAGPGRLNTEGHVVATRLDILTPLEAVHCNLYNGEKHVIYEFSNLSQGGDFDGVEGTYNKAVNADKYSLLCYYV
jgi:hypothetical protein